MRKRITAIFLSLLLLIGTVPFNVVAETETEAGVYKTFYVSPDGSDDADGSENSPFKTLERARDEVRKYNQSMTGDIVVNLLPGRYERTERFELDLEDSGYNGYDVVWRSTDAGDMATISGARVIDGEWTKGEDGIWHTKAEELEFARELFVDGTPAQRARDTKKVFGITGFKDPADADGERELGFYIEKSKIGLYENPEDIELRAAHTWKSALYHVEDIIPDKENSDRVIVIMDPRFWPRLSTKGSGTEEMSYKRGFLVENAYELLDEPGEFYFNKKTKVLSYYPREGQDMTSAEVLCPVIDQLLYVRGVNYHNVIKNIRFENIKLAHTTNELFEKVCYAQGQGEYLYPALTGHHIGKAANLVAWAENVDFEACQFFGLSAMGLHLREGVRNSEIVGNVFTDLGASGLALGNATQKVFREPKNPNALGDVAWSAGWDASGYHYSGEGTVAGKSANEWLCLNTQRDDDEDLSSTGTGWYSKFCEGVEAGTKHWIKVDLDDEFTLEYIKLSFPGDSTAEERNNFEVLLSKDEDFTEYKTATTFTSPAQMTVEVPVGDGETYRYIMIRKTTADENLALNGIWAMSKDRGPMGQMGAPHDILISNNYFDRVAQQLWSTYPIWLNYTKGVQVLHNELYNAPYTGISIGWGWDNENPDLVGENVIANNRIDNVMRNVNDGGGIYIFGRQWNSILRENFISNVYNLEAGIYFDNGCTGVTAVDNVCMNTGSAWLLNSNTRQNVMKGQWSDGGAYQIADGTHSDVIYTAEDVEYFSYSNPPEEVTRIMGEAGLESEWEWIKTRTADYCETVLDGPDAAESYHITRDEGYKAPQRVNDDVVTANKMLELGDIGYLPWQYSPDAMSELEYWVSRIGSSSDRTDDFSGGHIDEMYALEAAIVKTNESSVHPSWDEMVKMCDEIAEKANSNKVWGGYSAAALATFKKGYAAVKATNPKTDGDKALAAGKLEKLYGELDKACFKAEILGFSIDGGITKIDKDNQTVTVRISDDTDRKTILPEVITNATAKVAVELSNLDYTKDKLRIPLFETNLRRYVYWTVEILPMIEKTGESKVSNKASDWTGGNPNSDFGSDSSGMVNIAQWFDTAMCTKALGNKISFSINASRADAIDGIGMIFAAQATDVEATGTAAKNAHYLLLLKGQNMELYKVDKGVRTLCATAKGIAFEYGKFNPFEIKITEEGGVDRIKVWIEGDMIMDTLAEEHIDDAGYFGIISKNVPVKIK